MRSVRPVGSSQSVPADVRILSATNRDLDSAMAQGQFREDLYYPAQRGVAAAAPLSERRETSPAVQPLPGAPERRSTAALTTALRPTAIKR